MVQYNLPHSLPFEEDLPETDNQPVDNELQLILPVLLRTILSHAWADRNDWFFGVNLGVYYHPQQPAIGPDGFLSLGVERVRSTGKLRLSYLLWREHVVPQWVLEIVSQTPGGEYDHKLRLYAEIGVLYYTIYNPDFWRRDRHDRCETYRLINGTYVRQSGNPVWMPEIGLGVGYEMGEHDGLQREWLYWYTEQGNRLLTPQEQMEQERQRADQEQQRADQEQQRADQEQQRANQEQQRADQEQRLREELLERLRSRGIDPDQL